MTAAAMKQRKDGLEITPRDAADSLLWLIRDATRDIERIEAEYNEEAAALARRYDAKLHNLRQARDRDHGILMKLMKQLKGIFFDGTDVVNLRAGSLIHNVEDKVTIPRTALATCETLGFNDVIKIAKSLDRDAVEKWPDAKLFLIGAERKPVEEFSYDLKKDMP